MNLAAPVRAAIVATLKSVPDIGVVHEYQRYSRDLNTLKKFYVSGAAGQYRLRGWYVTRIKQAETQPYVGGRSITCGWVIRGFMALDDDAGSELIFDDLVDSVCDAFRADETLGGTVFTTSFGGMDNGGPDQSGLQVPEIEPVMFAGVLCHAARLELLTRIILKE